MNSSPQRPISNADLSTKLRSLDSDERWAIKLVLVRQDGSGNTLDTFDTNGEHAWCHALDMGFGLELQPYDHWLSEFGSTTDGDFIFYKVAS